jgi:hypothetical protein
MLKKKYPAQPPKFHTEFLDFSIPIWDSGRRTNPPIPQHRLNTHPRDGLTRFCCTSHLALFFPYKAKRAERATAENPSCPFGPTCPLSCGPDWWRSIFWGKGEERIGLRAWKGEVRARRRALLQIALVGRPGNQKENPGEESRCPG